MPPFELTAKARRQSAQERDQERQGCLEIGSIKLTGPTPQAQAMTFELTQKKRQAGRTGERLGGLFEQQADLQLKGKQEKKGG